MRAYFAQVDQSGLRRFLPEDTIPEDFLPQLIREWSLPTTAAVRAVLEDDDAKAVRGELAAGRQADACGIFLDRAVEVHRVIPTEESRRHPRH
jgi:hypothetical protein